VIVVAALAPSFVVTVLALVLLVRGGLDIMHQLRLGDEKSTAKIVVGALVAAAGVLLLVWPQVGAATFSGVLAGLFLIGGAQRVISPLTHRETASAFVVMTGVVAILLGILILALWPIERFSVLGVLAGIEIMINGMTVSLAGKAAHRAMRRPEPGRQH
ncbi:MAG: hypothetical protein GF331_10860, partial [Chitinivibrionales bacterium]|nr:hypothetical protein [Chitinivibrionales bacterium]